MISEASPGRSDGGIVPNNPTKDRAPMHRFLVWFASYSGLNEKMCSLFVDIVGKCVKKKVVSCK